MKPGTLIYDKVPYKGFNNEAVELDREIFKHEHRTPYNFTDLVISADKNEHEYFVQDGEWYRGLVSSDYHLCKVFKLMREIIHWRTRPEKGWLRALFSNPGKVW